MAFHASSRWGGAISQPSIERMREILAELDIDDVEHPCVSLTHESEWSLSAYPGGLLVWENLEEGKPRHLNDVSRERALALWLKLAEGRLAEIEAEPWLPGYEDTQPNSGV